MTDPLVHPFRRGEAERTEFGYLTESHPRLDRVQNTISAICGYAAAAAIIIIVVLTLSEVVLRTFFNAPQGWTVAFIEKYMMTVIAFFGMVTAYRSGAHIAVATLFNKFPNRVRKVFLVLSHALVLLGMLAIGIAGVSSASFSFVTGEGPVPGAGELLWPSWIWRSFVPTAMILGSVLVAIDIYRELVAPIDMVATDYDPGEEIDQILAEADTLTEPQKDAAR